MSINTEQLVEYVRRNAILYDPRHKHYKNIALKATVWESIAQEMNLTSGAVKGKWKLLRDNYNKYKRHKKNRLASSKQCTKQSYNAYNTYHQLSFLDQCTQKNFASTNSLPSGTQSRPNVRPPRYLTPSMDSDQSQTNAQTIRSSVSSHSSLPNPAEFLKLESNSPLPLEEIQMRKQSSRNSGQNKRNSTLHRDEDIQNNYDECDHLFASYACSFKRLPPLEQILMKLKLAKLFANVELRMLQNTEEPTLQYNMTLTPER